MNENNEILFPEIYILFLRWPKNYQDLPDWMLFFNKTKKPSKTPVSQRFLKYFRIRIFLPFYQIVYKIKCTYTNPHNSKNVNQSVWFRGRKQLITVQEDPLDTKLIGLLG